MDEVLKRTIDKYRIVIDSDDKSYILNYFDNRKK